MKHSKMFLTLAFLSLLLRAWSGAEGSVGPQGPKPYYKKEFE